MTKNMIYNGLRLITVGATIASLAACNLAPAPKVSCVPTEKTFDPNAKPNYEILTEAQLKALMAKVNGGGCDALIPGQQILISPDGNLFFHGHKTDGQEYLVAFNRALTWGNDPEKHTTGSIGFQIYYVNKASDGDYSSSGYATAYVSNASNLYNADLFSNQSSQQSFMISQDSQPVNSDDFGFQVGLENVDGNLAIRFEPTKEGIELVRMDK